MAAPPRWLVLVADWSNIIAGLILVAAFGLVVCSLGPLHVLENPAKDPNVNKAINQTFFWEGVFWFIAAASLTRINVMTDNAFGAVSQTIIAFGGIFFTISGLGGIPSKVLDVYYVIPLEEHVNFADACPYWGITCFMVATSMGLFSVMGLPKDNIISPFWGVACFFIGAWLIGVFGFWGPCLAGGFDTRYSKGEEWFASPATKTQPTFTWTWVHAIQLLGAIFLTAGGVIFGAMDHIFGGGGKDDAQDSASDSEEDMS